MALEKNPGILAADAHVEAVQQGTNAAKPFRYLHLDFAEAFTRGINPVDGCSGIRVAHS
jgi:hypothetical protein